MQENWCPSAEIATLRQRANILQSIRTFFQQREVLEVDTPILSHFGVTDVHLQNLTTTFAGNDGAVATELYLQTSPEYAMKRLLCAGSGSIYQISKAFRDDELGRIHNPEFTMLEWYRTGFDHIQLMQEVADLLEQILVCATPEKLTYQQVFQRYLNVDPLQCELAQLQALGQAHGLGDICAQESDPHVILPWLFAQVIEPQIGQIVPCFVYDFPVQQACLARQSVQDPRVAHRFEVYFKGLELANGFYELQDAQEQRRRFEADNLARLQRGLPIQPLDEFLLEALEHGLPDCAGVAMGIDRLIMLALGKKDIAEVLAFPVSKA